MIDVRGPCARGAVVVIAAWLSCVPYGLSIAASEVDLRIVTEEFPPFDFVDEDGAVVGMATEVLREVLGEVEVTQSIEILPWARAFKIAQSRPGTLLYSVVRTAERERQFHWVGIVCEVKSYLFRLKSRTDIQAGSLSDLKRYSVGVVRDWAGQPYLERNGFERLQLAVDSDANIKKLVSGRVDLIEDYESNLIFRMKKLGLDPRQVEKVYFNAAISGPLYAVFNRQTDPGVVERFRDAFSLVHLDGRYERIQRRWRTLE